MDGYKTLIGAVLAVGCGMFLIYTEKNVEYGMVLISMGVMGFGLGSKLDKLK